ncbi:hypothetical protein SAMN03159512_05654 [Pseudomonas sp. NFR09]|uniref:hypothetical protein n=1 Tax=Pseudomonas sp. NFR09 TaxID=1566249 RepID=UPI0008AF42C1|nr:hypothetical protein [Pseudomonas sp. NFR09]SEU17061.1 hypothetical protein SAMN03159512_05654 [Pseudomonas sp. NFR09]
MGPNAVLKPLSRTLQLKPIKFSVQKPGEELNLVDLMDALHVNLPTVGQRTWTIGMTLGDSTFIPQLCYFFNNYKKLDENTCLFEVWSYEPGLIPLTLTPDPNSLNAIIDGELLEDEVDDNESDEKKRSEFIEISHVLVFGGAAIIESTRNTGGVNYIQRYLNKKAKEINLGRRSTFFFTDAISGGLQQEIDAGGGAVGFTVGMSRAATDSDNELLGVLSQVRSYMPSSGMLTVDWRSKDKLPTAKVIEAYSEAQDLEEIENVIIHLNSGSSIRNVSQYKIKRTIHVTDAGGKNPDRGELCRKMVLYLEELTTLDAKGERILDDNGELVNNEIFIPNSRRVKERKKSQ